MRIDARSAYEPDALVTCCPRLPRSAIEVPDPVIVVEVLSPGTGRYDRQDELARRFTVPSLCHCVVVDADRRIVIHHARDRDAIATRLAGEGLLRLDPPGLDVAVEDPFGGPPGD